MGDNCFTEGAHRPRNPEPLMTDNFFTRFFDEKDLDARVFDVTDSKGLSHSIPSEVVIEAIHGTRGDERRKIEGVLRKIDFANGDVNHFLAHLARGLAESYRGALR